MLAFVIILIKFRLFMYLKILIVGTSSVNLCVMVVTVRSSSSTPDFSTTHY
jgi:hypothetical protein